MGNRAVLKFEEDNNIGIYLHWNGGPESILAFLKAEKKFKIKASNGYELARLTQMIANFFGGKLSIGIGLYDDSFYEYLDNGIYYITNYEITKRICAEETPYSEITKVEQLNEHMKTKYEQVYKHCIEVNQKFFL